MSFILDALKKSELERQRQSVPGLMDSPPRRRRNRLPVWAIALGALLVVNLLVLCVVLVRRSAPAEHPAHAARNDATAGAVDAARPQDKPFSPMDAAPVYAPEIPVAADADEHETSRAAAGSRLSTPRSADAGSPSAGTSSSRRADPLLTDAQPSENEEVLPTINEMTLTGAQALPDLHLDVHVYATRPAERFVYINMRKYHEGAVLQEGPTLERIRRDGVVLNYQGLRFILPRQP